MGAHQSAGGGGHRQERAPVASKCALMTRHHHHHQSPQQPPPLSPGQQPSRQQPPSSTTSSLQKLLSKPPLLILHNHNHNSNHNHNQRPRKASSDHYCPSDCCCSSVRANESAQLTTTAQAKTKTTVTGKHSKCCGKCFAGQMRELNDQVRHARHDKLISSLDRRVQQLVQRRGKHHGRPSAAVVAKLINTAAATNSKTHNNNKKSNTNCDCNCNNHNKQLKLLPSPSCANKQLAPATPHNNHHHASPRPPTAASINNNNNNNRKTDEHHAPEQPQVAATGTMTSQAGSGGGDDGDVFIYPPNYRDLNECQKCSRDNKICNCNVIEPPAPSLPQSPSLQNQDSSGAEIFETTTRASPAHHKNQQEEEGKQLAGRGAAAACDAIMSRGEGHMGAFGETTPSPPLMQDGEGAPSLDAHNKQARSEAKTKKEEEEENMRQSEDRHHEDGAVEDKFNGAYRGRGNGGFAPINQVAAHLQAPKEQHQRQQRQRPHTERGELPEELELQMQAAQVYHTEQLGKVPKISVGPPAPSLTPSSSFSSSSSSSSSSPPTGTPIDQRAAEYNAPSKQAPLLLATPKIETTTVEEPNSAIDCDGPLLSRSSPVTREFGSQHSKLIRLAYAKVPPGGHCWARATSCGPHNRGGRTREAPQRATAGSIHRYWRQRHLQPPAGGAAGVNSHWPTTEEQQQHHNQRRPNQMRERAHSLPAAVSSNYNSCCSGCCYCCTRCSICRRRGQPSSPIGQGLPVCRATHKETTALLANGVATRDEQTATTNNIRKRSQQKDDIPSSPVGHQNSNNNDIISGKWLIDEFTRGTHRRRRSRRGQSSGRRFEQQKQQQQRREERIFSQCCCCRACFSCKSEVNGLQTCARAASEARKQTNLFEQEKRTGGQENDTTIRISDQSQSRDFGLTDVRVLKVPEIVALEVNGAPVGKMANNREEAKGDPRDQLASVVDCSSERYQRTARDRSMNAEGVLDCSINHHSMSVRSKRKLLANKLRDRHETIFDQCPNDNTLEYSPILNGARDFIETLNPKLTLASSSSSSVGEVIVSQPLISLAISTTTTTTSSTNSTIKLAALSYAGVDGDGQGDHESLPPLVDIYQQLAPMGAANDLTIVTAPAVPLASVVTSSALAAAAASLKTTMALPSSPVATSQQPSTATNDTITTAIPTSKVLSAKLSRAPSLVGRGGAGGVNGEVTTNSAAVLDSTPQKSIFDGASKDEILEYLNDARERVPEELIAADEVMVINENEVIVVNQLEPSSGPATPISIVEENEVLAAAAASAATTVMSFTSPSSHHQHQHHHRHHHHRHHHHDRQYLSMMSTDESGQLTATSREHSEQIRHRLQQMYETSSHEMVLAGPTTMSPATANRHTEGANDVTGSRDAGESASDSNQQIVMATDMFDEFDSASSRFKEDSLELPTSLLNEFSINESQSESTNQYDADDGRLMLSSNATAGCGGNPESSFSSSIAGCSTIDSLDGFQLLAPTGGHQQQLPQLQAIAPQLSPSTATEATTVTVTTTETTETTTTTTTTTPTATLGIASDMIDHVPIIRRKMLQQRHQHIEFSPLLTSIAKQTGGAYHRQASNLNKRYQQQRGCKYLAHELKAPNDQGRQRRRKSTSESSSRGLSNFLAETRDSPPQHESIVETNCGRHRSERNSVSSLSSSSPPPSSSPSFSNSSNQTSGNCSAASTFYASSSLSCSSPFLASSGGPTTTSSSPAFNKSTTPTGGPPKPTAALQVVSLPPPSPSPPALLMQVPGDARLELVAPAATASQFSDQLVHLLTTTTPFIQADSVPMVDEPLERQERKITGPESACPQEGQPQVLIRFPAVAPVEQSSQSRDGKVAAAAAAAVVNENSNSRLSVIVETHDKSPTVAGADNAPPPLPPPDVAISGGDELKTKTRKLPTTPKKVTSLFRFTPISSPPTLMPRQLHSHYATINRLNNYLLNRGTVATTTTTTTTTTATSASLTGDGINNKLATAVAAAVATCCEQTDLSAGVEFQCLDCDQFIDANHAKIVQSINEARLALQLDAYLATIKDKLMSPEQMSRAYVAATNGLPLCKSCWTRRNERKEIISEFVDTELKYGRDLKIIHDEFYRPMQIAGLLSKEQINGIFLNLEELLMAHLRFAERLELNLSEAANLGDTDLNTVNIGKLFMDSAGMLHTFESYCIRQGSAACQLARLAKEKELLRIFLRVSQMENTLLRRMNLAAFLMVPVQRVTKYPLLLNRLYKVTPYHHKDREPLRDAQLKVELHLEHINQQTRGVGATNKIWRRISNLSALQLSTAAAAANTRRVLMNAEDISYIKLRKTAMDMLKWDREETQFIHSSRVHFAPLNEFLIAKQRVKGSSSLRYMEAHALLIVLGKPNWKYRPDMVKSNLDSKLMIPTQGGNGIKEAALLLFREKNGRFVACREPLFLSNCVLSNDCSQHNSECPTNSNNTAPTTSTTATTAASAANQSNLNGQSLSKAAAAATAPGGTGSANCTTGGNSSQAGSAVSAMSRDCRNKSISCGINSATSAAAAAAAATAAAAASKAASQANNHHHHQHQQLSEPRALSAESSARILHHTSSEVIRGSTGSGESTGGGGGDLGAQLGSHHDYYRQADSVSMSSLKSLPDEQINCHLNVSPSSSSPPLQAPRSYSLASALPRTLITTISSSANLAKSTGTTSSNLTILNQFMTKVNQYHHNHHHSSSGGSGANSNNASATSLTPLVALQSNGCAPQSTTCNSSSAFKPTQSVASLQKSATIDSNGSGSSISNQNFSTTNGTTSSGSSSSQHAHSKQATRAEQQVAAPVGLTSPTIGQASQSDSGSGAAASGSSQHHYNHHFFHNHHHQQPYGDYEESFEIHERLTKESLLLRADTPLKTRYWLQILRYHAKDLGHWRTRRNGLANIMMMRHE